MREPRFFRWTADLFGDPNTGGVQKFLAGPARDPKVPAWPCPAGLAWPGRPGLAWLDLADKRGQDLSEIWPGGLPYGPPGAGMHMGGSVSVSGCVSRPCWAILGHGGSVRGHFPYFRISNIFQIFLSIFPIIPGVAGLLFTGGRTAKKEGGSHQP